MQVIQAGQQKNSVVQSKEESRKFNNDIACAGIKMLKRHGKFTVFLSV